MKCRSIALSCLAVMTLAVMSKAESQMPKKLTPSKTNAPAGGTAAPRPVAIPDRGSEMEKRLKELKAKVAAGDMIAIRTYALHLLTGSSPFIAPDTKKAIELLEQAASKGDKYSCNELDVYYYTLSYRSEKIGGDSNLLAESLKYRILGSGFSDRPTGATSRLSNETKEEGKRRADAWAKANSQTIPVSPK